MSLALLTELRTRLIPSKVGGDGSHESTQGLVVAENYGGGEQEREREWAAGVGKTHGLLKFGNARAEVILKGGSWLGKRVVAVQKGRLRRGRIPW